MAAIVYRGNASVRDYTPGAAVTATDVITIGALTYVATHDIVSGELGQLNCPDGGVAYRVTLATAAAFTDGAEVYIDGSGDAAAAGTFFGWAEGAADQAAGATHVIARHDTKAAA